MRPAYLIALVLAVMAAFWSTGRADTALAPWGLNRGDCVQVMSAYYCGDAADRIGEQADY